MIALPDFLVIAGGGHVTIELSSRALIINVARAVATWPLAARSAVDAVIGSLPPGKSDGYRNFTIEFRWADDREEQLTAVAADFVHEHTIIVAGAVPTAPIRHSCFASELRCFRFH